MRIDILQNLHQEEKECPSMMLVSSICDRISSEALSHSTVQKELSHMADSRDSPLEYFSADEDYVCLRGASETSSRISQLQDIQNSFFD